MHVTFMQNRFSVKGVKQKQGKQEEGERGKKNIQKCILMGLRFFFLPSMTFSVPFSLTNYLLLSVETLKRNERKICIWSSSISSTPKAINALSNNEINNFDEIPIVCLPEKKTTYKFNVYINKKFIIQLLSFTSSSSPLAWLPVLSVTNIKIR